MSSKCLVLGVVVTLCASCAVSREPGNDKLDVQAQQRLNRSQTSTFFKWDDHAVSYEACQEQRGEVRRVCMFGQPMCVMPYSDADGPCQDSSDCEGKCLYEGDPAEVGTEVSGSCQADDDPCGCFIEVANGRATHTVCVD